MRIRKAGFLSCAAAVLAITLLALIVVGCDGASDEPEPAALYLETVEAEQERFAEIRMRIAEMLADIDPDRPNDAWAEAAEGLLFEGIEYSEAASDLLGDYSASRSRGSPRAPRQER